MDNFFFGGGVGLGFGTVDWVALEPLIGYRINPHVSIGASLLYQWMNDDRYDQSVSTTSYGGSGFVQYYPVPDFFLQAEYQYLNYDYVLSDLTTQRATASSYFGGVGVSQPMSGKAAFFASALYDFSYEANDPTSPYTSPWIIRAGVAVGF